ncbi:MAG: zinc ribbon domain-containing protein [Candidatus Aminicenantales bacterium]
MAIKRCPYCKAIIDESEQYCNNCGTQLLFPEDEFIEEDIPGEKIIYEEFKEEESEEAREIKENLDFPDQEEELDIGKKKPAEVLEEEQGAEELKESGEFKAEDKEVPTPEDSAESEAEVVEEPGKSEEPEEEGEPLADTAEIARLLNALEKDQKEMESFDEKEEVTPSLEDKEKEEPLAETEERLPPWVEVARETPPSSLLEEERTEEKVIEMGEDLLFKEEEVVEDQKPSSVQTGMGIPETVEQSELPLRTVADDEEELEERVRSRRPGRFFVKLKALLFDLLFVFVFWLLSLWGASRLMEIPLLQLISGTITPLVVFYGILLASYLFLFLFFLGETLGDRFMSPKN